MGKRKDKWAKEQNNFRKKAKQWISWLLIACILAGGGGIKVLASETREEKLPSGVSYADTGKEIEMFVKEHESTTAGVAIAVFDRNQEIYKNYFGYADIENQVPLNQDNVMEWGSITKVTVWISVMQLWEQGKIDLNEDIRTYLPEGFLTNLNYDTPITMLNLMNHKAGFQEMFVDGAQKDREHFRSLGEQLKLHEPQQVYDPGTVMAYSNWGSALAGYIVECISGQSFDAYVQEHIFKKLGMNHTTIACDLSDNQEVWEKRQELKCYTTDLQNLGTCFYYITLYPEGSCIGTLDDLLIFAQALLPKDGEKTPLFEKEGTLEEFLAPTAYFGDTSIPLSYHGLLGLEYGVQVRSHGGNFTGTSAQLIIEPESGVGMVIMVNQRFEETYTNMLPELIYGSYADNPWAGEGSQTVAGVYRAARSVVKGPLALESLRNLLILGPYQIDDFNVMSNINGVEKISTFGGDYVKLSPGEYVPMFIISIGWAIGIIYSAFTLVVGGCIITPFTIWKRKKKPLEAVSFAGHRWNYLSCGVMMLLAANITRLAYCLTWNAQSKEYIWQFILAGILGIIMLVLLIIGLCCHKKWNSTGREKIKYIATGIFLMFTIASILYWHMYEFWQLS